jgi:ankyrin repeat protein
MGSHMNDIFARSNKRYKEAEETIFLRAAKEGDLTTINRLVKRVNIFTFDKYRSSAISLATEYNHPEIVKVLIENNTHSAVINTISLTNSDGWAPIHLAVIWNNIDVLSMLIKTGCDVNITGTDLNTPLYLAANHKRLDAVKLLIENRASVNQLNMYKNGPLCRAVAYGDSEMTRLLIENGADVNNQNEDGYTPLHTIARSVFIKNHIEVASILLDNNATIDKISIAGYKPFCLAVLMKNLALAKFLIDRGGVDDINLLNDGRQTLLYSVIESESNNMQIGMHSIDTVKFLIENGADVNKPVINGDTPLHKACEGGYLEMVDLLLKNGANINTLNEYHRSPLHTSISHSDTGIIKLLLLNDAEIYRNNIYQLNRMTGGDSIIRLLTEPWTPKVHEGFPIARKEMKILFNLFLKDCQIRRLPKDLLLLICSFLAIINIRDDQVEMST